MINYRHPNKKAIDLLEDNMTDLRSQPLRVMIGTSDPMSYTGRGSNFSSTQLDNMIQAKWNVGNNSAIMRQVLSAAQAGSWGVSTNLRPFYTAPNRNQRIPLPLKNP